MTRKAIHGVAENRNHPRDLLNQYGGDVKSDQVLMIKPVVILNSTVVEQHILLLFVSFFLCSKSPLESENTLVAVKMNANKDADNDPHL